MIDSLGLFGVVFTDPVESAAEATNTKGWNHAYELLSALLTVDEAPFKPLRSILLASHAQSHLAWLLCAVVPLARYVYPPSDRKLRTSLRDGAFTAQEGLKLDNNASLTISDALRDLDEIITMKNGFLLNGVSASLPLKRGLEDGSSPREKFGMAIRKWASRKNSNWRLSVLFALLVEQTESASLRGQLVSRKAF